jgi:hypothetical protein
MNDFTGFHQKEVKAHVNGKLKDFPVKNEFGMSRGKSYNVTSAADAFNQEMSARLPSISCRKTIHEW